MHIHLHLTVYLSQMKFLIQGHMLFLYRNDHLETKNVADAPEKKEIVAQLQKEILARRGKDFMKQVPKADKPERKGTQAHKRK